MRIGIRQRKRAEARPEKRRQHLRDPAEKRSRELFESEQRLKRAQEIAHLGSWELDLLNNKLSWSDEAYRIFGLEPQEFEATYEAFLGAVHPDDRQAVDAAYSGSISSGKDAYEIEHRVIRKTTGEIRYVHEKCEHIRDSGGKIIRSVGMVHDITERKLIEIQLQRAHEELEIKVGQRTEELVELNKQLKQEIVEREAVEKRIRFGNAILKLFGKAPSRREYLEKIVKLIHSLCQCQCAGMRVLDEEGNIPYESYIGFSPKFWEAENRLSISYECCACVRVMTQRPEPEDAGAMTKGGSFCLNNSSDFISGLTAKGRRKFRAVCLKEGFLSIAIIPVRYKERIIAGIHLADKAENKFPPELVKFIESVTDLIGEGIYKFTLLEKIRRSNELLEQSKRLSDIGSLAATVAHELRNPLGVIRAASYNIKRKAKNLLLDGHFANIEKKILEADQIINNLLFYSRLKAQHIERVRVFDMLKESIGAVKNKYKKYPVSIAKKIASLKEVCIEADPLQLGELFNNILSNAYDALAEKRGRIEVAGRKDSAGNIILQFKDNGTGMGKEELKRIFEPFYTTKAKGTGLGLAVCKQIVTLHNGTIELESEKGKGSTVRLTLPLKRINAPANLNS